jgi:hypothetical protein
MSPKMSAWAVLAMAAVVCAAARADNIESPPYSVVHAESDFEIRLYRPSTWISTPVEDISFSKATQIGFHKLFQYIQGANLNNSRVEMTTPVLTGIVPSAGPFCSSAFVIRFFVPHEFKDSPPLPLLDSDLSVENWDEKCVAVRAFTGFAKDTNVAQEAAQLEASLQNSKWANITESEPKDGEDAYTIAQYSSPFKILGRVNEVWVSFPSSEGCHAALLNTKAGRVAP